MSLEIVLIAVLLNTPPDDTKPISPATATFVEVIMPAIYAVAINAELFDPRECKASLSDYNGTYLSGWLRERWLEAQQLPSLSDFPQPLDKATLNALLALNRKYCSYLTERLAIDSIHADVIRDAIGDTDAIYEAIDALRDAREPYYYVQVRRRALATVRRLLGDEAFYSGRIPAPVPLHHIPPN